MLGKNQRGAVSVSLIAALAVLCVTLMVPARMANALTIDRMGSTFGDGAWRAAAVTEDGGLLSWGQGYIGDGTSGSQSVPTQVLDGVVSVATFLRETMALKADGTVWTWGYGSLYELGNGSMTFGQPNPEQVMDGVVQIAACSSYGAAVKEDGTLWVWGWNGDYSISEPMQILDHVVFVDLADQGGAAIREDGSLWTWGDNSYGQLGNGWSGWNDFQDEPQQVIASGVVDVSLAYDAACALMEDGRLLYWGRNDDCLDNIPGDEDICAPVQIMDGVADMSLGDYGSLAVIKEDRSLWMWGANDVGQVGNGATEEAAEPVKIMDDVAAVVNTGSNVSALQSDGSLWRWGNNSSSNYVGVDPDTFGTDVLEPLKVLEDIALPGAAIEGGATDPEGPEDPDDPAVPDESHEIEIAPTLSEQHAMVRVAWNDAWFDIPATVYHTEEGYNADLHQLATTASVLSAAAYQKGLMRDALLELGCDEQSIEMYYPEEHDYENPDKGGINQVAYAFGTRESDAGYPIVFVVVRGTHNGAEWLSNINIADSTEGRSEEHEGFATAAQQVLDALDQYVFFHVSAADYADARVLVTGHSRGAAVANLVAKELTDAEGTFGKELAPERIYGYTFAAPAVHIDPDRQGYDNIYNIVNPEDVVPGVPLADWGYGRYGETLVLPSQSNTSVLRYRALYNQMNALFQEYAGMSFIPNGHASLPARIATEATLELASSVRRVYTERYPSDIVLPFAGRLSYTVHTLLQSLGTVAWNSEGIDRFNSGLLTGTQVLATPAFREYVGKLMAAGIIDGFPGKFTSYITHGHTMETYIAWMQAAEPDVIFTRGYRSLRVACPVDVRVYDESGALVAAVVDDAVDESLLADGLPAYINGSIKMVDIPQDAGYRVELTARASGTMDVSVEEYTGVPGEGAVDKQGYVAVPLAPGDAFSIQLDADAPVSDALVVRDDGAPVGGDPVTADTPEVTVDIQAEEGGAVWGGGPTLAGAEARVEAETFEGYAFAGWFDGDGAKVADTPAYTLRPTENTTLTARFAKVEDADGTDGEGEGERPGTDGEGESETPGVDGEEGNERPGADNKPSGSDKGSSTDTGSDADEEEQGSHENVPARLAATGDASLDVLAITACLGGAVFLCAGAARSNRRS